MRARLSNPRRASLRSRRTRRQGRFTPRTILPLAGLVGVALFVLTIRPTSHVAAPDTIRGHAQVQANPVVNARTIAGQLETDAAFRCTVTGVHDGDGPIYCREGMKIRLAAIAAREIDESCRSNQPCPAASGAAARETLFNLTAGHVLRCEKTGMSYARVTAWCSTENGTDISCAMVRSGMALPWEKYDPFRRLCSPRNAPPERKQA